MERHPLTDRHTVDDFLKINTPNNFFWQDRLPPEKFPPSHLENAGNLRGAYCNCNTAVSKAPCRAL